MLTNQATRSAQVIPYEGFRGSYKVVDYGNPQYSLYGMIIFVAHSKTEIVEALEFDNLKDFEILAEQPGQTEFALNHFLGNKRMILKRTKMTNEPFSFKSQYKQGAKSVKAIPGGAGGHGDHRMSYLTDEEKLAVRPPIEKKELKEKAQKDKNSLQLPKKAEKRSSSKGSTSSSKGSVASSKGSIASKGTKMPPK